MLHPLVGTGNPLWHSAPNGQGYSGTKRPRSPSEHDPYAPGPSKYLGNFDSIDPQSLITQGQQLDATAKKKIGSRKVIKDEDHLMSELKDCFLSDEHVDFTGSYNIVNEPPILDKERIQVVTQTLWKVTGYRFTVKDHPQTKDGHKTRLWCSQDVARKHKPRSVNSQARMSVQGDPMAKARYHCQSRLLISSHMYGKDPDVRQVTIRLSHQLAHGPYDPQLHPGQTKAGEPRQLPTAQPSASPPPSTSAYANPSESWSSSLPSPFQSPAIQHPFLPLGSSAMQDPRSKNLQFGKEEEEEEEEPPDHEGDEEDEEDEEHADKAPSTTPDFEQRMRLHINNIRDFCDGLEYQLQFKDFRMLDALENQGAGFLQLVRECLIEEGRLHT